MKRKISKFEKLIWIIASIIEWLIIPVFIACMGYNINFEVYNKLKNWEHIQTIFYTFSTIDIIIYLYFSVKFSIIKLKKERMISQISAIIHLVLLIIKVKL